MVYMSKWLRIFDSGGWGVVCCGWGFLTLGVGFCMLCPINQSAVSYDSHWTTSRLDNGTYTRSLRKSGLLNTPLYSPHHPSSITLTDTRLSVRVHHVDEFRDLEYIPVPGFIFLSNLPIFYRILRSHR